MTVQKEYLTPDEVATILDVHPETVRRWIRSGELAASQPANSGRWRVHREDLQALIATGARLCEMVFRPPTE